MDWTVIIFALSYIVISIIMFCVIYYVCIRQNEPLDFFLSFGLLLL